MHQYVLVNDWLQRDFHIALPLQALLEFSHRRSLQATLCRIDRFGRILGHHFKPSAIKRYTDIQTHNSLYAIGKGAISLVDGNFFFDVFYVSPFD